MEHEHAAHIKAIFSKHDADQSGFIDAAELPQALAELGVDVSDAARVEAMLADVDTDRSGQLDLPEFSQIFATGRLRSVFDEIDLDRSGTISTEELGHALKALGCWDKTISRVDHVLAVRIKGDQPEQSQFT